MEKINCFIGKDRYLSNFWEAPVMYEGILYQSNEAAFQAAKTLDGDERQKMAGMNPSEAKRYGRRVRLRSDWEEVKTGIMKEICTDKFTRNPELAKKLLATDNACLEEGNNWGDRIWGTVNGVGENRLGKILMEVREELKDR